MARRPLDVGVIGCGTAGAAAALLLCRAGHKVTVYERVERPNAVGAGIMLQPTGQAVLASLGLLDGVLARAEALGSLRCETLARRQLFKLKYGALPGGHRGYGLHRGALFERLFAAVRSCGVTLETAAEVADLQATDDNAGLWFVQPDRTRLGPHELCVVADGSRSRLRDDTTIRKAVRPYPWGAVWCVLDDPDGRFVGGLHQVLEGTRRMVGALPSGLGPGDAPGPRKVSVFYSIRHDRAEAWKARGLEPCKRELREFIPALDGVLDGLVDPAQLVFTRYQDVAMYPWNTDRVVYLGDAAHAMSPQLGQGANLALMDAHVLAHALEAEDELAAGLARYSRTRRSNLAFYSFATRWLTPWFQSDHTPLGWLRDLGFPLAMRVPGVERLMVKVMAGLAQGTGLGPPLALPAP